MSINVQELAMLNSTISPKEYWSLPEIAKEKPSGKFTRLYFYDDTNLHQWHTSSDCIFWHPVGKIFIITDISDDIDTTGHCANCGVEFHIHKEKL